MGTRNRFRLDLNLIHKLLENLSGKGATPAEVRAQFPELGGEKVRAIREWADDLDLTCEKGRHDVLTPLGHAALSAKGIGAIRIQEILYYKLATSKDLEVSNALVNSILCDIARSFDPTFSMEEIKSRLMTVDLATEAAPKYLRGEVATTLNALTTPEGLGKLGIVVPIGNSRYRVNPYRPDWRSAAYMLYSSWPENVARVRINEIVQGNNSLGRVFFLTESQVMVLLSKLEQERIITLEMIADLHQLGRNPAMKAQDFLEMLVHDQD